MKILAIHSTERSKSATRSSLTDSPELLQQILIQQCEFEAVKVRSRIGFDRRAIYGIVSHPLDCFSPWFRGFQATTVPGSVEDNRHSFFLNVEVFNCS